MSPPETIDLRPTTNGALLPVQVIPNASVSEVRGVRAGALRVAIHAPPEKGRANRELLRFLARRLRVPRNHVLLARGETSRKKDVLLVGLTPRQVCDRLGNEGTTETP